jgi:mRNA interferase RelE/StbE
MKIEFSRRAAKHFRLLHRNADLFKRILTALSVISINPEQGKALDGDFEGSFSYRVGDWRILYQIDTGRIVVFVITIAHRREVYRQS